MEETLERSDGVSLSEEGGVILVVKQVREQCSELRVSKQREIRFSTNSRGNTEIRPGSDRVSSMNHI